MLLLRTTKVFERIVQHHAARIQILQGGSSSSKTWSCLQYLLYLAINVKGPLVISVVSETLPHLRKGAERDFYRILGDAYDEVRHNKTERIYRIGNNLIEFFSADQPSKVRGPRRDILFLNEANAVSKETFDQLEIRTRAKVFLDFNPTSEFWAHELVARKDVYYDISTYLDNTFLDPNIIKSIESRRYGADGKETDWWKVYGEGQIGLNQGCIYTGWSQVDKVPEQVDKISYGLDFGFSNDPTALVRVSTTASSIYVEEMIYDLGMTNDDIDIRLNTLSIPPRSSAIYADSSDPKSIEDLRRRGWAIKGAVKAKDSILRGIDYIKSKKLYVTKDSLNIIKELRNYKWETDSNGKPTNVPVDMYDHGMDAVRYGLNYKILNSEVITKRMKI